MMAECFLATKINMQPGGEKEIENNGAACLYWNVFEENNTTGYFEIQTKTDLKRARKM